MERSRLGDAIGASTVTQKRKKKSAQTRRASVGAEKSYFQDCSLRLPDQESATHDCRVSVSACAFLGLTCQGQHLGQRRHNHGSHTSSYLNAELFRTLHWPLFPPL